VNMQQHEDDVQRSQHGWKAQVVSLYKSWFFFTVGCYFFVLRVLQEFFKSGEGNDLKKSDPVVTQGSLRMAGEHEVEKELERESSDLSQHTVVDLAQSPAGPSLPTPPAASAIAEHAVSQAPVEPTADQSKNTLVIKNLPFKFKLADLEKLLSERDAKSKNVRLLRDDSGKFTGMAFVRCASKEDAQKLIGSMHGLDISGRNIQVEFKSKKQKKKGKLNLSSDSLSSSSDELPVNRIRISAEHNNNNIVVPTTIPVPPPQKPSKLSVSADHTFSEDKQTPAKKQIPPQLRRKSTCENSYSHSAVQKIHTVGTSNIRPIRQPYGPDGKSNGFSTDYRKSRTMKN